MTPVTTDTLLEKRDRQMGGYTVNFGMRDTETPDIQNVKLG